jgi:hypothetical protein
MDALQEPDFEKRQNLAREMPFVDSLRQKL